MRTKISTKNINYFLRQEFGFNTMDQLFKYTEHHPAMREKVIMKTVQEFTGYFFHNGKLTTVNPYTNSFENLKIKGFGHVASKEDLLKELSTLHKTRMAMLEKSRKKLVELSKKKDRDKDLEATVERRSNRETELKGLRRDKSKEQGVER